jgi:hypothetical protein
MFVTDTENMTPSDSAGLQAAADRLARVRDRQQALLPLRNLLADADEDARAAAIAANAAGLSERAIAARLGVAQPTVHSWLDGRTGAPLPEPSVAVRVWALHHIVSATTSEAARLIGEPLPTAPSSSHTSPTDGIRKVRLDLDETSSRLGLIAAALDYAAHEKGRIR